MTEEFVNSRDFKGIWIPREVWLNRDLTMLDKVILMEIDSLDNEDGCTASNEYLCDFCQCSERKVSESVSKLVSRGFLRIESFNGRKRVIRSLLSGLRGRVAESARQGSRICEAASQKVLPINIDSNIVDYNRIGKEYKEKSANAVKLDLSSVPAAFKDVVGDWLAYKREKGKTYKQIGFNAFWKKLYEYSGGSPGKAREVVEQSMANNWDGIFPIRQGVGPNNLPIGMVLDGDRSEIYRRMAEDGMFNEKKGGI